MLNRDLNIDDLKISEEAGPTWVRVFIAEDVPEISLAVTEIVRKWIKEAGMRAHIVSIPNYLDAKNHLESIAFTTKDEENKKEQNLSYELPYDILIFDNQIIGGFGSDLAEWLNSEMSKVKTRNKAIFFGNTSDKEGEDGYDKMKKNVDKDAMITPKITIMVAKLFRGGKETSVTQKITLAYHNFFDQQILGRSVSDINPVLKELALKRENFLKNKSAATNNLGVKGKRSLSAIGFVSNMGNTRLTSSTTSLQELKISNSPRLTSSTTSLQDLKIPDSPRSNIPHNSSSVSLTSSSSSTISDVEPTESPRTPRQ